MDAACARLRCRVRQRSRIKRNSAMQYADRLRNHRRTEVTGSIGDAHESRCRFEPGDESQARTSRSPAALRARCCPWCRARGAIWVGSSGRLRDASQQGLVRRDRGAGRRRHRDRRPAGRLLSRLLRRVRQFGAVAGAAFAPGPDPSRRSTTIAAIARSTPSWRAACCASVVRTRPTGSTTIISSPSATNCGACGVERPLGFFLHTPWPSRSVMRERAAPSRSRRGDARLRPDRLPDRGRQQKFRRLSANELGLRRGRRSRSPRSRGVVAHRGVSRSASTPTPSRRAPPRRSARHEFARLRASLQGVKLAIGVDRVDYSKGLDNRIRAFDRMLTAQPSLKGEVSLLQIAVPSR